MQSEEINELYFDDVDNPILNDRRDFLKKLGGGIIVVFWLGKLSLLDGWAQNSEGEMLNFNAYLRVKEDGRVDCYTGKIEMGQGIITSLAQVVAEELEVSIYEIDMVMGDTDLCPYDAGTWGSRTTRFADPVIRSAAAETREILLDLASKRLDVSKEELHIDKGIIFLTNDTSQQVTFAELTKGKKIVQSLEIKPEIKTAKDFKIIGKPIFSTNAVSKVTGMAQYSADIKLPGMVYANVVRPKVYGSTKLTVDASGLSIFDDVELIETTNFVAVVHPDPEISKKASRKVKITWEVPETKADNETIFKFLENNISKYKIFKKSGKLSEGKELSETIIKGGYYDGYKAHAPMETHSTTCYFDGDKLIIWTSTQTPFGIRKKLSNTLDIPEEKIQVKQILLGGGFGGKIYNQQAIEAAIIARSCGKPVQLVWSRKEEFMYDQFRTAAVMNIEAGVDTNGKLTLFDFDIYCAGSRGTVPFYKIENYRIRIFNDKKIHPLGTGAWRAPGNNSTTFARESHIDVMAHKLGVDPLKFRLDNINEENLAETLKLAADTFDWKKSKKEGHGYGIALGFDAGTWVAIIAEVKVDKTTREVQPIRIVCAQDMGQVVNPQGATIQTEGGITMGLGYALFEDIEFNGGKIKSRNFRNYEITKFSKTPKIECVFIDKMDSEPQGGGEPAIICVGGAIANAVFDACGARVNRMPITPKRILENL